MKRRKFIGTLGLVVASPFIIKPAKAVAFVPSTGQRGFYGGSAAVSKTTAMIHSAVNWLQIHPNSHGVYVASDSLITLMQFRNFTSNMYRNWTSDSTIKVSKLNQKFTFSNGSTLHFTGAENHQKFMGYEIHGLWFDKVPLKQSQKFGYRLRNRDRATTCESIAEEYGRTT